MDARGNVVQLIACASQVGLSALVLNEMLEMFQA